MLTATDHEDFIAATQALDRVLTTGRYVIPMWYADISRIAHRKELKYPAKNCRFTVIGSAFNLMSGGMRSKHAMLLRKILVIGLLSGLAACNTVAGVGQDITGGADTVQGWIGN